MQVYRSLLDHAPGPVRDFRAELEALDADTQKAGLAAERLSRHYSAGVVARFALGQGLALLLGAPLALCGMVLHVLPYQLTAAAVRLIPHTDEEEATDKIAAGLVLYPLAWALEAWAAYAIGGKLALIALLVALLPTGFFALAWRARLEHVGQEAGAFLRFLRDRELPHRLRERRRALAAKLAELARIAPLAGRPA